MSEPLRYRYFKYTRGTAPEPVIGVLIVEILERVGNTKFDDGLGWNLNLLLRLWIEARARLPLLLHQLAKTGQDKFAVLFGGFVGERAERIEECSSGSFVGLGGFAKRPFQFRLGH